MPELQQLLLITAIAAPASAQLIDTWINGSLFETHRRFIASGREHGLQAVRLISELLLCPRCLSHWTAALLLGMVRLVWEIQLAAPSWILLWLATVGLTRLIYQVTNREEGDPLAGIKPYEPPGS